MKPPSALAICNCDCLPHLSFCNLHVFDSRVFYVVEKFEQGLSVGYWNGDCFLPYIDDAMQESGHLEKK